MHPKLEYEIKQAVSSLEMMAERYMPSWEGGGACAALNVIKQLQELVEDGKKEIVRLEACLQWEQNRASRIGGTHWHDCHTSGTAHYECLLRKYEEARGKLADAALQDLADESQRLGLYDITHNPMIKDEKNDK